MRSNALLFVLPLLGTITFIPLSPFIETCSASTTAERRSLQKEQKSIQGQLTSIKKDIDKKQAAIEKASDHLRASEKAISDSNRTLKQLAEQRTDVENRLADLKRQAAIVGMQVKDADALIGQISQAQFVNSRRSPWQNAIEGGNPNDVTRMSAMLRYMEREQTRTIDQLENRQKNIESVTAETIASQKELAQIVADEKKNKAKLEQDKSSRQNAVALLRRQLNSQKERYEQLQKNQQQLSQLIESIDRQIALNARKEKERLAKEKAKREAEAKQRAAQQKPQMAKPDPRRTTVAPAVGNFGNLRGKLTMPTKGSVAARFGQKREGAAANLAWRGLLIRAPQGQNVVATASGTVVFSDWMRGFGNLLIVDHGSNYLSVYANNESLLKSRGDRVKQGETIATVGNSGGEDEPGLYFELRYKGKPFNPQPWMARR
jgi:septal ring factor EnvC (AmiA/AmiB activator)